MIIHNLSNNTTIKIDHLLDEGVYYHVLCNVQNTIPENVIQSAKNKELKIVFDLSYEGWIQAPEIIYKNYILPYNIDSNDLILLTGSASAQNDTNTFCESIGIEPFTTIWHLPMMRDIALQLMCKQKSLYHNNSLKSYKRKNKKFTKCFLNFNRRWRYHRPALVGLFKVYDLLDKGYISLSKSDDNIDWNSAYDHVLNLNHDNAEFTELWINNKHKIRSIPNMTLDFEDLTENKASLDLTANIYYYNSYFSVVSETNFFQSIAPSVFFSEKTFKPIAFKHPFILVTVPNSLPMLRQLGYKTFSPYIDESYDMEINDGTRLLKIVDEINRLCSLKDKKLEEFIDNITPIVNHNYKVLLDKLL